MSRVLFLLFLTKKILELYLIFFIHGKVFGYTQNKSKMEPLLMSSFPMRKKKL